MDSHFGRLVVVSLHSQDANHNKRWLCRCTCGKLKVILGDKLKNGSTQSCGCYQTEFRKNLIYKADVERRLYTKKSHAAMINRCYNPKAPSYARYGAAGVKVCDRWREGQDGLSGWLCFYADMGPKPTGHSIDRINNELGYFLANCRWASRAQQASNRRPRNTPTP
jgi:hypothetical protein